MEIKVNVHCRDCNNRWFAVAQEGTTQFKCPRCLSPDGGYATTWVRNNEKHHACECGNELFLIAASTVYCPACGRDLPLDEEDDEGDD